MKPPSSALGGYGFCKDYPLEQYLRDAKIMSLYEGTNGIQAMDLMGRKMRIRDDACLKAFQEEISAFCSANEAHPSLGPSVKELRKQLNLSWACPAPWPGV